MLFYIMYESFYNRVAEGDFQSNCETRRYEREYARLYILNAYIQVSYNNSNITSVEDYIA